MTCKDCIHYEACLYLETEAFGAYTQLPFRETCKRFKPKSRYTVLPCAVGDKVYWINRSTKEIETDIVISIRRYEDGFSITTKTIGTKCTCTYSLDRFLEIMHFTKKEAEKALKEKQQ